MLVAYMMGEQLADALRNLSNDPVQLLQYWGSHNAIAQQSADFFDAALHSLDPMQQPLAYLLVLYVFHIARPTAQMICMSWLIALTSADCRSLRSCVRNLRDYRAGQQAPQHADEGFIRLATTFLTRCLALQMTQIRSAPEKRKYRAHSLSCDQLDSVSGERVW